MTRIQDHNALRWQDKPGPWDGDTNLPETLQRRLTSISVIPPTEAELRATAALVRRHATDERDEARLLAMLGIRDG